jgi:hypothetical protein
MDRELKILAKSVFFRIAEDRIGGNAFNAGNRFG